MKAIAAPIILEETLTLENSASGTVARWCANRQTPPSRTQKVRQMICPSAEDCRVLPQHVWPNASVVSTMVQMHNSVLDTLLAYAHLFQVTLPVITPLFAQVESEHQQRPFRQCHFFDTLI